MIFLLLAAGVISILAVKMNIKKEREKKASAPGNAEEYSLEHAAQKKDSPLRGKRILFLGSSVTYGEAANGTSFADYLGKIDGVYVTKEAVSATTLADEFSGNRRKHMKMRWIVLTMIAVALPAAESRPARLTVCLQPVPD